MEKRTNEIRELLSKFTEYNEACVLQKELNDIANKTYKQEYTDTEHINFLNRNDASIKQTHPQETNFPYYLQMFTVITQHIYADNVRQILDKGIHIEKQNNHE